MRPLNVALQPSEPMLIALRRRRPRWHRRRPERQHGQQQRRRLYLYPRHGRLITGTGDQFGYSVALSGDGATMAVRARLENSAATGVGGDQSDNSATNSGAVYLY